MAFKGQIAVGTVEGTGSAINVELGFIPAYVEIINETDPGLYKWYNTMADAEMLKVTDAVAMTFPTTNGISAYAGTEAGDSAGFTIGADSDMNAASDVLHYFAVGTE